MAVNVSVYKHGILIGTGSATGGSAALSSYSGTELPIGKNVQITVTSGDKAGLTWAGRVLTNDGGGNVTVNNACPVVE